MVSKGHTQDLWKFANEKLPSPTQDASFLFLALIQHKDLSSFEPTFEDACSLEENFDQPRQYIKKQSYDFANKGPSSQSYGFSGSHVWIWELDYKESWVLKNWFFWTVVLEETLESPLDCKEIQPIHPRGNQSGMFIGRIGAEAETPILWPPDMKNCLIWKDPDAGNDWRWEEKGTTEDEMVG